jgi:branched-chain amino acid transport system permease protein
MTFADLLQIVIGGIAMGAIYVLSAQGLLVTNVAAHQMNFGQGDFLMIAAFLAMTLLLAGVPTVLVLAIVAAALAVLGVVLERVALRPIAKRRTPGSAHAWILTTMGFGLLLQNAAALIWGRSSHYSPPLFSAGRDSVVRIFGVSVFREEIAVIVAALVSVAAFYLLLMRSRLGKSIQVVAFDAATASLLGIDVRRTIIMAFVLASVLAAASGVLVGPLITVQPTMGLVLTIKALAVASIGGFANPLGILAGGLAFGVIEAVSNYVDSGFGDLYPLLLVIALLMVRPTGLLGPRRADAR